MAYNIVTSQYQYHKTLIIFVHNTCINTFNKLFLSFTKQNHEHTDDAFVRSWPPHKIKVFVLILIIINYRVINYAVLSVTYDVSYVYFSFHFFVKIYFENCPEYNTVL